MPRYTRNGVPDRRSRWSGRRTFLRAERQAHVIRLYRELVAAKHPRPQAEVARRLATTVSTVKTDLDAMWPQWRAAALSEVQAIVDAACAECDWVKAQARVAWEESKLPTVTVRTEDGTTGQGVIDKTVTTTSPASPGDPRFLAAIMAAEDMRIRLTVGYKPTKTEAQTVDLSTLDDDQLARLERGEPLVSVLRKDAVLPPTTDEVPGADVTRH